MCGAQQGLAKIQLFQNPPSELTSGPVEQQSPSMTLVLMLMYRPSERQSSLALLLTMPDPLISTFVG